MVKMLESKTVEVIKDPKSKPEVDDKPKSGPEVIAELITLQEEIFSRPTKVIELLDKTLVDLPAESTMEPVPPLAAMKTSLSLRPPDEYDPWQICLQEIRLLMMQSAVGSVYFMNGVPQSAIAYRCLNRVVICYRSDTETRSTSTTLISM